MPLDHHHDDHAVRSRLRKRVFARYAEALQASPDQIVDFLCAQLVVATHHLPTSTRYRLAEKIRDACDLIERGLRK